MRPVHSALLSVHDKTGIVEFARGLADLGVDIVSTGGTARLLGQHSIPHREVSSVTGFPEILDGRVKTINPLIAGGLLAIRSNARHMAQVVENRIPLIDLVCVNLYPFSETVRRAGATFEDAIENIDIGGPSMIRAAAKNFQDVAVVTSPEDYPRVLEELRSGHGVLPSNLLFELARAAFAYTARYDGQIAEHLFRLSADTLDPGPQRFSSRVFLDFELVSPLRYGENDHQRAGFYRIGGAEPFGVAAARKLNGKELSFNNIVDLQAAWDLAGEFSEPFCALIKHTNPCGAAIGETATEAYQRALAADPVSAFGSAIAFNTPVDRLAATELSRLFVEGVIAPGFTADALEILRQKANLRILDMSGVSALTDSPWASAEFKYVSGGALFQERDMEPGQASWRTVTTRPPTDAELRDLRFAWKVAKHVKSNAIVLATGGSTVGVGAGQMSRVDSVRLSVQKALSPTAGTVLGSDAFFPFRDGLDEAARAGVTAVVQPGGSRRDEEVITAANEHGMAMVFTGVRHFKH